VASAGNRIQTSNWDLSKRRFGIPAIPFCTAGGQANLKAAHLASNVARQQLRWYRFLVVQALCGATLATKKPKPISLEQTARPGCGELLEVVLFAPQGSLEQDFLLGADVRFGTMVLSSEDWSKSVEIGRSRATLGLEVAGCEIDPSAQRFGDKKPSSAKTHVQRTQVATARSHVGATARRSRRSDRSRVRALRAFDRVIGRTMPKIPEGMIQLRRLPVGEDGAPVWNDEVEAATQRFESPFLAPFMVEVSPGMVIGGYVARATFETQVRTYEAKASLIVRKNDELRTTVVVSAPGTRDGWKPYIHEYKASLPKIHLENMVHTIRGLCEQSHAKELLSRGQSPEIGEIANSTTRERPMSDPIKDLQNSIAS
jgi:hypothetical protein